MRRPSKTMNVFTYWFSVSTGASRERAWFAGQSEQALSANSQQVFPANGRLPATAERLFDQSTSRLCGGVGGEGGGEGERGEGHTKVCCSEQTTILVSVQVPVYVFVQVHAGIMCFWFAGRRVWEMRYRTPHVVHRSVPVTHRIFACVF